MGIDKSDVRTVIHFEVSDTIESFCSRICRAGQDGKKSYSIILKSDDDVFNLEKRFQRSYPNLNKIKNVFKPFLTFIKLLLDIVLENTN